MLLTQIRHFKNAHKNKENIFNRTVPWKVQQHRPYRHCFYSCFLACWAWNKDTVPLYSTQYCIVKYTKAQPVTEDARTWQCTPDTWTNYRDCTRKCTFTSLNVHHLEVRMQGLAAIPLSGRQPNLSPEETLQGVTDRSVQRWDRTGAKRQKGTQFSRFFMYKN